MGVHQGCQPVQVAPGESLLVVGPSGAGKTSLLRAIAGLWSSGSGKITRHALASHQTFPSRNSGFYSRLTYTPKAQVACLPGQADSLQRRIVCSQLAQPCPQGERV